MFFIPLVRSEIGESSQSATCSLCCQHSDSVVLPRQRTFFVTVHLLHSAQCALKPKLRYMKLYQMLKVFQTFHLAPSFIPWLLTQIIHIQYDTAFYTFPSVFHMLLVWVISSTLLLFSYHLHSNNFQNGISSSFSLLLNFPAY